MGIYRYIKMTFIDDIKNSLFYMIVLIFSIVVMFHTFNIILNEQVVVPRSNEYIDLSTLGFVILAVSCMFIVFANSYYLEEKFKEYAVITLSGRSIGEVCKIVVIRNFIITITSVVVGCVIGVVTSFPVMKVIFNLIGVTRIENYVSQNALIITALIIFTELESVFLINTGSIYRKNINELVNRKKRAYVTDNRMLKLNPIIYILVYLLPVISIIVPNDSGEKVKTVRLAILIGIFGVQGIIRYVIPNVIANYRNKKLVTDKFKLIILSNLYYSIQKSIALILFLVVSTILTISIGGQYKIGTVVNTMSLVCYGLIIVVMSLTVVYKFLIEAKSRKENFEQLKLLGYTKDEVRKIIGVEVIAYYAIIMLLPLIYITVVVLGSSIAGLISSAIAMMIVFVYVGVFMLTGVVSLIEYRKLAA
jgi:putative ABC transport system permease protein